MKYFSYNQLANVYGKKSFLGKEQSDTKILQSIYFAYEVVIISYNRPIVI